MTINTGTFEILSPSRFISFTFSTPLPTLNHYGDFLRIAVLDSSLQPCDPPKLAAMLVPINRENDWIFSTETGQLELLSNFPSISRLILVGNPPQLADHFSIIYNRSILDESASLTKFEESLTPILLALSPKSAFRNGIPEIPFLTYEDDVISSVSVDTCIGSRVGEMLVEDIEIEIRDESEAKREFRRRLRFKRMPNLVQTEIRIVPESLSDSKRIGIGNSLCIGQVKFRPDMSCLVHPYLPPMVASLSLISPYLQECVSSGAMPRVLCVGVGGGALLSFLQINFGFRVFGVESDEMVLNVAKKYFGLVENDLIKICVGDGIEVIEQFACRGINGNVTSNMKRTAVFDGFDSHMDIIMVDLDASDAIHGPNAPPLEFVRKSVLLSAKLTLHKLGILVVNVIPVNKSFYDYLIAEFRDVFSELYEINVGNDENYVLIAAVSPIHFTLNEEGNSILKKLKLTIPMKYMNSIKKI